MSPRTISKSIDTCTFQLHSWRPFQTHEKTENNTNSKTCSKANKRACLSDRLTRNSSSFSIENLDMSKLSLFEEDGSRRGRPSWAKKRRRRRSVSGRSCSVGGGGGGGGGGCVSNAYGTCSDFMMANNGGGTSSSGELFVNINDHNYSNLHGYSNVHSYSNAHRYSVDHIDNVDSNVNNVNWEFSDTSESRGNLRNGNGERELGMNLSNVGGFNGMNCLYGNGNGLDSQGNESGYGSEPGYRGDAEFGYGDEFDEEEVLFWSDDRFGDAEKMEIIGEKTLQKAHHRCRRKKHELRMVDAV